MHPRCEQALPVCKTRQQLHPNIYPTAGAQKPASGGSCLPDRQKSLLRGQIREDPLSAQTPRTRLTKQEVGGSIPSPLYKSPAQAGFLLDRGRRWAQFWNRSGTTQRPSESGVSSHTSSSATRPCSSCRSAVPAGACSGRRRQALYFRLVGGHTGRRVIAADERWRGVYDALGPGPVRTDTLPALGKFLRAHHVGSIVVAPGTRQPLRQLLTRLNVPPLKITDVLVYRL